VIPPRRRACCRSCAAARRRSACARASRYGGSPTTSAVTTLLGALGERDAAVRWRVVYALEKLPLPARIVPAVTPLLRDPDPVVRAHAARTLGRLKSSLASSALRAALTDDVPAVTVNALRALQLVNDGTGSVGSEVASLLHHRDPYVRVTAATALADSFAWVGGHADSVAVIGELRHALGDRDPATRGACARALLVRTRRAAIEAVRGLSVDSSAYVRSAVLDGLRAMQPADLAETPPRVVNALAGGFRVDGHPLVRMTAAEVAGQLLGRTHHPALAPLLDMLRTGLDDRDVLVAAACAGALADAGHGERAASRRGLRRARRRRRCRLAAGAARCAACARGPRARGQRRARASHACAAALA
jgi:HEAT repeat protein